MREYFKNRDYNIIYLHRFFYQIGNSVSFIFGAVIMYQLNFPIWLILLFYAFQFGIMGLSTPLSAILLERIGLPYAVLTSMFLRLSGLFIRLSADGFSPFLFLAFIPIGLSGGIYNPYTNGLMARYVESGQRGKIGSMANAISSIGSVVGALIVGLFLHNELKIELIFMAGVVFSLSAFSYFFLSKKLLPTEKTSFKKQFNFLLSKEFKKYKIPFGIQTFLIIESITLPLFIYILIGDVNQVAQLVALSIILQLIIVLAFGRQIDNFAKASFLGAVSIKSASSLLFMIFTLKPLILFFKKTFFGIAEEMFYGSYNASVQNKSVKFENPLIFSSAKEMILCFSEFFLLSGLAGIAYFMGEDVFILIFLLSFISIWVIYKSWKH